MSKNEKRNIHIVVLLTASEHKALIESLAKEMIKEKQLIGLGEIVRRAIKQYIS